MTLLQNLMNNAIELIAIIDSKRHDSYLGKGKKDYLDSGRG